MMSNIVDNYASKSIGSKTKGVAVLRDPQLSKGRSYTVSEKQLLQLHGLLPPAVLTQEDEVKIAVLNVERCPTDLDKYIYLMDLLARNERLFYRVIMDNIEMMLPIIYTPTVGLACQNFGLLFRHPQGLYITILDVGRLSEVLSNWPETDIKAIVVTDGERILGLGDLGTYGMGIPIGKLALYTACAGVPPSNCLPITLDVGTNNQTLLDDPLYTGLRQSRVTGVEYEKFIDEFMQAVVNQFGQHTLIQFEDFGNHNAFQLLQRYRDRYCTFNDDIQGTSAVVVAGLMSSLQLTKGRLSDHTFLFQGAGEAAIGTAHLLAAAMREEGITEQNALQKIWMVDSKGLIVKDRPSGGVTRMKLPFAKDHAPIDQLVDVVTTIKPTAIIGVAAVGGAFSKQILQQMATFNERPIIFALSNPTSKAECTAEQAYQHTEGRCIFASGSPFAPVTVSGKTYFPGQCNNSYIFPGVGLAVVLSQAWKIPDTVFLKAARSLSKQVTPADLHIGRLYPALKDIREVSVRVAIDLVNYLYEVKLAMRMPQPADIDACVRAYLYTPHYSTAALVTNSP